jgi:hypothetical protein
VAAPADVITRRDGDGEEAAGWVTGDSGASAAGSGAVVGVSVAGAGPVVVGLVPLGAAGVDDGGVVRPTGLLPEMSTTATTITTTMTAIDTGSTLVRSRVPPDTPENDGRSPTGRLVGRGSTGFARRRRCGQSAWRRSTDRPSERNQPSCQWGCRSVTPR